MTKINFNNEQIEYIKNASDHVEVLCGGRGKGKTHKLINEMQNKINNLQSKIDKAIEYIEKSMNETGPFYERLYGDVDGEVENLDELLDILKEDK